MKKGIVLALTLLLAACGGNGANHYYQLPITPNKANNQRLSEHPGARAIWLARVNVSDYLTGGGVVYQESDVRYVAAGNNLWASPLEQQLGQTMVAELSNALPGVLVSFSRRTDDDDQLEFNITGFHGRYDGRAIVQGEWLLTHHGQVTRHPFTLALKQRQDGYDDLVRTLAQGWQDVAADVARQVMALP